MVAALLPAADGQQAVRLRTAVDPRVELLTVVARLAGFREFTMANSRSPYSEAVAEHFGSYSQHPAVLRIQTLRAKRGVSYDAVPSLAVHLGALPALDELVSFDLPPERLDARWGGADARGFLAEFRDFAKVTKAAEFFEQQAPFYARVAERLQARLSLSRAIPWFDAFFGAKPGAQYTAIAGLLCGGGNFGVGVRFPDGRPEQVTPVFGCWEWDEAGLPIFGEQYLPLFVHELCHTYTNAFVDRFERELQSSGTRIYATCSGAMAKQGYGNWKTVVYESLVRASVIRCRLSTEGEAAAKEQSADEASRGFRWVPGLAETFGEYEADRERFPTFAEFMPRVVAFFVAYAAELDEQRAAAPQLVSMDPANGATDVDPALTTLVITFDREMKDKSWSVTGSKADLPEITGSPSYDAARRVLTVPVRLEPDRSYSFGLNNERFTGFQSADGVPLAPLEITFATSKARR